MFDHWLSEGDVVLRNVTSGIGKYLKTATGFGALFLMIMPSMTMADDINLVTRDGSASISGELLDYTDSHYRLRTSLGDLVIAAWLVDCFGTSCPVGALYLSGVTPTAEMMIRQG